MTIRSQADNEILHNALKKKPHWEKKWFMEFDADKSHVQRVTTKQNRIIHDYTLHGKILETMDSAKYLGVTSDLRWNRHVENHRGQTGQINHLSSFEEINSPNLKSVAYNTLVWPLLETSSAAWDPYTKEKVKKLEMVQRRASMYVLNRYNNLSSVNCDRNCNETPLKKDKKRIDLPCSLI